LVPRLLLNSKAIPDADAVFNLRYTGTHRKAVEDVLNGQADLAGCSCSEIDSARKHASFDKKAIVLDSFNNIPLGPIVFNKRSDAKLAKMITRQLLKLHLESPAVLTQFCNGWTEFKQAKRFKKVSDKEYDAFRALFGNNLRLWKLIE
jgi:ABC-type phosphate/phosphonate transport system substrate-binding protein